MKNYDDIINLPHHVSESHAPMSMANRAAQFAPFAALNGHDDAISETARLTDSKIELSDGEKEQLSRQLSYAVENGGEVGITYFQQDLQKRGGYYLNAYGVISKIDEYVKVVILADGRSLPLDSIYKLSGAIFDSLGY